MIRILDATVGFLFTVLLSLGAIIALFMLPPVGILLFYFLYKYMGWEFKHLKKPSEE
ncbi:hypothetical protein [Methanocella sp. MCL-LM]|uniref:hypothetical protein n=1 Tax=Methanocella sp. MCL-LM TaxID=3412035 RepID=UPI003C743887